ncbi:MAG: glycosyl transferase, partial [Leptospiraceae bacterium]|nr:glycosyl transferase [Leptospiraceae bacterium]
RKDWKKRLMFLPIMIMIGTGIAIVNTRAWLEAILGIKSSFKRTPKLNIETSKDNLKEKNKYSIPLDFHVVLEFFMGLYCTLCVYLSFKVGKPYIVGFLIMYAFGFFFVAINSLKEALWSMKTSTEKDTEIDPVTAKI